MPVRWLQPTAASPRQLRVAIPELLVLSLLVLVRAAVFPRRTPLPLLVGIKFAVQYCHKFKEYSGNLASQTVAIGAAAYTIAFATDSTLRETTHLQAEGIRTVVHAENCQRRRS